MSGGRRGAAVLGSPIAHSLSPVLHLAAYAALGLDDWTYRAIECTEADLAATLQQLDAEGLAGVSLTMPLKRAVLPLLARSDRLVDEVGAANTTLFGGVAGEWWGGNTDVPGMVSALRRAGLSSVSDACVLGGGATAMSALAALRDLGALAPHVVVRRPQAVDDLLAAAQRLGVQPVVLPFGDAAREVRAAEIVVATTPAGATDALAEELSGDLTGWLFDVVYSPWPTRLAAAWAESGGVVVGGLDLLVEQAAEQVRLMTGHEPPVAEMRAAGHAALTDR
ncbi:MAG: shikimate dehydrogenase [Frankiales bacterium]|nr:shikimate dehydrogenase [Frankiales bacterium]